MLVEQELMNNHRLHQQLHWIGKSHECFGYAYFILSRAAAKFDSCNSSDEQHHKRHKAIFKLVQQIKSLDIELLNLCHRPDVGRTHRKHGSRRSSIAASTDASSEMSDVSMVQTRSKRAQKKAEKAGLGIAKHTRVLDICTNEDINFVSEAIHLQICDDKGAWHDNHENELDLDLLRDHYSPAGSTMSDMETDNESVHSTQDPDKRGDYRNAKARKARSSWLPKASGLRSQSQNGRLSLQIDPYLQLDRSIFYRLGIELEPFNNSKPRKELIKRLVIAIKEDLDIMKRENDDYVIRKEAFWRWAGKEAYHRIKALRDETDWTTGQRKNKSRYSDVSSDLDSDVAGTLTDYTEDEEPIKSKVEVIDFDALTITAHVDTKVVLHRGSTREKEKEEDDLGTRQKSTADQSNIPTIDISDTDASDSTDQWYVVTRANQSRADQYFVKFVRALLIRVIVP